MRVIIKCDTRSVYHACGNHWNSSLTWNSSILNPRGMPVGTFDSLSLAFKGNTVLLIHLVVLPRSLETEQMSMGIFLNHNQYFGLSEFEKYSLEDQAQLCIISVYRFGIIYFSNYFLRLSSRFLRGCRQIFSVHSLYL